MKILDQNIRNTMSQLQEDVDWLLDNAKDLQIPGAINWADLGVIDVIYCVNMDGDEYYIVEIDEAAPDNPDLHQYLYEHLVGCGVSVEIRTER